MIQALGWFGSALVVASLALPRPLPFRYLNLVSAIALLAFDLAISLWSMVALNLAILAVNAWHLRRLLGARRFRSTRHRDRDLGPAPPTEGWFTQPETPYRVLPGDGGLALVPYDGRLTSVGPREHG
jgi:hypothetical protein